MEKRKQSPTSASSSNKMCSSIKFKDKTCPICLTQIPNQHAAVITNCMHAYCLHCLLRWSQFKRTCPLCNSHFNSYFSSSSSSPSSSPSPSSSSCFRKHRLRPLSLGPSTTPHETPPVEVQRLLRRTMLEVREVNRRSRPVPRLRFFGRLGSVPSDVVAERNQRILQWRASIYKNGLSAIPFSNRNLHNLESTDMFWHELRCFAESAFTMDTYDEVVEYREENRYPK